MKNQTKPWTPEEVQILKTSFENNKSAKEIATLLNRTVKSIYTKKAMLKIDIKTSVNVPKECADVNYEDIVVSPVGKNIHTLEGLIEYANIDKSKNEIVSHTINTWEMMDSMARVHTLTQVKAQLKPLSVKTDFNAGLEIFKQELSKIVPSQEVKEFKTKGKELAILSIPDLHLGKLSDGDETGYGDYNTKIACDRFSNSVDYFIPKIKNNTEKTVLVLGNDFFNTDSYLKTTTAGTPQDEDSRWMKTFRKGCELLSMNAEKISKYTPVEIIIVRGNHDMQRSFYAGLYLEAYFRNNKNVKVHNQPIDRKYILWNNGLFGFAHGDKFEAKSANKHKDLRERMMLDAREGFAKSTYQEWFFGHLHHQIKKEFGTMTCNWLPSLCEADTWHAEEGFCGSTPRATLFKYGSMGLLEQSFYTPIHKKANNLVSGGYLV